MKKEILKFLSLAITLLIVFSLITSNISAAVITDGTKYYIAGDVNEDGAVDLKDLVSLKKLSVSAAVKTAPAADFDSDGKISANDFVVLRQMLLDYDDDMWSETYTK